MIVMNFANADMVGHSGKMEPTVRAVEAVDACLRPDLASASGKGRRAGSSPPITATPKR